jgi:uncharacterized protein
MRYRLLALCLLLFVFCPLSQAQARAAANGRSPGVSSGAGQRILVYTKNGAGYVHQNIAASVQALQQIGAALGYAVDASEDPAAFTDDNLKRYAAIVFANSNNEIFSTDEQRDALRHFVQAGGGVVGIHSAIGSERTWPWFAQMMGGRFRWHPVEQDFTVRRTDVAFSENLGTAPTFAVHDECYFNTLLNPDIHTLLTTDRTRLTGLEKAPEPLDSFPNPLPLAWWHTFDGGREFYVALGHEPAVYAAPWFQQILRAGLVWAARPHPVHGR